MSTSRQRGRASATSGSSHRTYCGEYTLLTSRKPTTIRNAELRDPRRTAGLQPEHQDTDAHGGEEDQGTMLITDGGDREAHLLPDQPHRPEVGTTVAVEGPEDLPLAEVGEHGRRVDEQPRPAPRRPLRRRTGPAPASEAHDEQGAEQEHRVELGRRAQTDQHAREQGPVARPRPQRAGHRCDGEQVPVDQPGPPAPARRRTPSRPTAARGAPRRAARRPAGRTVRAGPRSPRSSDRTPSATPGLAVDLGRR